MPAGSRFAKGAVAHLAMLTEMLFANRASVGLKTSGDTARN